MPESCWSNSQSTGRGGEQQAAEGDHGGADVHRFLPAGASRFHSYSSRAGRPIEVDISRLITWLNDSG